jgi:hypothetical protein
MLLHCDGQLCVRKEGALLWRSGYLPGVAIRFHHHPRDAVMLAVPFAAGGKILIQIRRGGEQRRAQERAKHQKQQDCRDAPHATSVQITTEDPRVRQTCSRRLSGATSDCTPRATAQPRKKTANYQLGGPQWNGPSTSTVWSSGSSSMQAPAIEVSRTPQMLPEQPLSQSSKDWPLASIVNCGRLLPSSAFFPAPIIYLRMTMQIPSQ